MEIYSLAVHRPEVEIKGYVGWAHFRGSMEETLFFLSLTY